MQKPSILAPLPIWARRCVKSNHEVSVLEKADGRLEVFCCDCYSGAGRGEILSKAQAELLVRSWAD